MPVSLQIRVSTLLIVFVALAVPAFAQDNDPPDSHREWGIGWHIRAGSAGGDYGEFMEKATAWDMDLFRQRRGSNWRFGVGLMFDSMRMKPPLENEPEWAHFETYGYASRVFRNEESIRPYLQGRLSIVRMHPRSELFAKVPIEQLQPGESPTDAHNGIGINFIPGMEFDVARGFAVDVAAYFNWYLTSTYPLQDYAGNRPLGDQEDPNMGTEWGGRIGATWRPLSHEEAVRRPESPDLSPLPPPDEHKDAWGVTRSYGWAYGEVMAINFGASMFNEYIRQANFNQISPRSFWHNLDEGFNFDDNKFKTNQYVHPFNGGTYFNSGRSNGLGFWASSLTALTGAFIWEAMGETHPMSYNDMVSTGIGGIAFGETVYRLSSYVLDNTATGGGRTWREVGAFLIDPIHGFNRFVSGRASKVEGNPSDPHDWRPPHYHTSLDVGARITGKGESISDSTETRPFVELYIHHGNPWDTDRHKPWDHFDTAVQFNGDDKNTLARFQIRGDLWSHPLGDDADPKHALAVVQHFDYINNFAYEFGGQSFGLGLNSRFRPSATWGITTRLDAMAMLLGAVNSEYASTQVILDQERLREYDYGPGAGFSVGVNGLRKGRNIIGVYYRANWINVKNGSVYNPDNTEGYEANHFIQVALASLRIPVRDAMNVGLDGIVYLRQSHFDRDVIEDVDQRVPQLRLLLSWDTSR